MTKWVFWGDRQILGVYGNIYLRTNVEDWFKIISGVAKEFRGSEFIDIGCGEGHSIKQILDRLKAGYSCDLLEPNRKALNSAKKFLSFENNPGKKFCNSLSGLKIKKEYDTVFTSHTNYYWTQDIQDFNNQLIKFVCLGKKGLILTLPENSDHYKIMLHQVYPKFNYAGHITDFYKKSGFNVKVKNFKMRMFVGDLLENKSKFELYNFYKFIHNTSKNPSVKESRDFLGKIKKHQKKGYLDFRDQLIIIKN